MVYTGENVGIWFDSSDVSTQFARSPIQQQSLPTSCRSTCSTNVLWIEVVLSQVVCDDSYHGPGPIPSLVIV